MFGKRPSVYCPDDPAIAAAMRRAELQRMGGTDREETERIKRCRGYQGRLAPTQQGELPL